MAVIPQHLGVLNLTLKIQIVNFFTGLNIKEMKSKNELVLIQLYRSN